MIIEIFRILSSIFRILFKIGHIYQLIKNFYKNATITVKSLKCANTNSEFWWVF